MGDADVGETVEDEHIDPSAEYMNQLPRNLPLSEYHDTLYITLMLILKSRHIITYLQIGLRKSNAELLKQLIRIERKPFTIYSKYDITDCKIRKLEEELFD